MRLGRWKEKDMYVALKILKKAEILKLKQVDHIMNEISILSEINHPFLVHSALTPDPHVRNHPN